MEDLLTEAKNRPSPMDINCQELITEIYHRPSIWNSKHSQHKNKNLLTLMWEEIQIVRFPEYEVDELKKKWKNLKDGYRKELKKSQILLAEDPDYDDSELSQWKYFNMLAFLKDECTTEKIKDESPDESARSSSQPRKPRPREEHNQQFAMVSQMPCEVKNPSRKRSLPNDIRAEYLAIERKKLKILEQEVARQNNSDTIDKSDDYYYLMSLLPEMQKFNSIQKMSVRNKINQVLMDEMMLNTYEVPAQAQNSFIKEETELI